MSPCTPQAGQWYRDASPVHGGATLNVYFKVLAVGKDTVQVQDQFGEQRVVNRLLFESQMAPATRVPMVKGAENLSK